MGLRFLFILLLILVAEFYAFIAVRSVLRGLPGMWRTGLLIAYVTISLLVWCGLIFFKSINWDALPHFARNIYIAFSLGWMIGKLLVLVVMLLDDARRLIQWLASQGRKDPVPAVQGGITRSQFMSRLALGLGGTALFGFLYGVTNRYSYSVRRIRVPLAGLPAAFKGLKIVQLSDIHSGSFDSAEAVAHGVEKAMAERPDLILFTGDLVNNKAEEIIPYKHIFAQLKAPLGVYSTLGNHDYGDYYAWEDRNENHNRMEAAAGKRIPTPLQVANLERLKQHHADMGWRLLMNEHVLLQKDGAQVALLGIENWSAKPQFPKYGDLGKAYTGLSPSDGLVKILMSHDPSHWDAQVTTRYPDIGLMLAGHTHGMQFGVEIKGFRWSPVQYMYSKWAGLYQQAQQHLYVNRGYGFLGYPGRLGILPEITVIELA